MKELYIFILFASLAYSFLNSNFRNSKYLTKLYLRYLPDESKMYQDMFDKFEYYSVKNDTKKQEEYLFKIYKLNLFKKNLTDNRNLTDHKN